MQVIFYNPVLLVHAHLPYGPGTHTSSDAGRTIDLAEDASNEQGPATTNEHRRISSYVALQLKWVT